MTLKINDAFIRDVIAPHEINHMKQFIPLVHELLHSKTGPGSDFLGWLDLPSTYDQQEFAQIKHAAKQIQMTSDVLVVIGIGGSYLGAKAVIEALSHSFHHQVADTKIVFAGHNMSGTYLHDLCDFLKDKSWAINVISKSGTTTEPALAFRVLKKALEEKYGAEAAHLRIFATTDARKGALKNMAMKEKYQSFIIPDDVGGRFSVLTAVGLLPIAVAGIDIDELMSGAQSARVAYQQVEDNSAYMYAILRHCLYNKGKTIELFTNYEPSLQYLGEWWKQLFGESEGKDHKGIFPASAQFSTDLHSLGQYIQDGRRDLFETIIAIHHPRHDIQIEHDPFNYDDLNFLVDATLNHANQMAMKGTLLAHTDGHVPNILIELEKLDAYHLGFLIYFFELACAASGYLLGVNPFDQEGVEAYKKNMFALLGKDGYETLRETLLTRLK